MSKKKIFAIIVFVLVGFMTFTFAGENSLQPTGNDLNIDNNSSDNLLDGDLTDDSTSDNIVPNLETTPNTSYQPAAPQINNANINNNSSNSGSGNENSGGDLDTTLNPVINFNSELEIIYGSEADLTNGVNLVLDPSDTTTTLSDLNISGFDKEKLGVQTLTYSLTDINGKTVTLTRNITVVDNEAPVIDTPRGTVKKLAIGSELELVETNVTDNFDKDLKVQILSSNVDMNKYGTYTVVLIATDSSGNVSEETSITIKVVIDPSFGYTDFVKIEGTLNNNIFEVGSTRDVLEDNLVVVATRNNGVTKVLSEDEYKVKSFSTKITNDEKQTKNATFKVKLTENTDIFDKVSYTLVRYYSLEVFTNVEGSETSLLNCGKVTFNSNLVNSCDSLNLKSLKNMYDGFEIASYSINGTTYTNINDLDFIKNLVVTENTKVVINYNRINKDTFFTIEYVNGIIKNTLLFLNNVENKNVLAINIIELDEFKDLFDLRHTNIDSVTIHYTDGDVETVDANIGLANYYVFTKEKAIERIEFNFERGIVNDYLDNTLEAKFTVDSNNEFYYYGE